jgi:3-oxoacyl-(acyl-carrier-protein) synthase
MINLKHPLELYAGTLKPNYARALLKQKVTTVLTNAFGFGGVNTSLVLAKHS